MVWRKQSGWEEDDGAAKGLVLKMHLFSEHADFFRLYVYYLEGLDRTGGEEGLMVSM